MAAAKQIHIYVRGCKHALDRKKIAHREVVDLGCPSAVAITLSMPPRPEDLAQPI